MKPRLVLCLCVFILLGSAAVAQPLPEPKVEIYIPVGMPIQLGVARDENEQAITRYNIWQLVGPETKSVSITQILIGSGYREAELKVVSGEPVVTLPPRARYVATAAWAPTEKVARLILIVKRIETSTGVWSIDADVLEAAVQELVDRGGDALPRAKFIKQQ